MDDMYPGICISVLFVCLFAKFFVVVFFNIQSCCSLPYLLNCGFNLIQSIENILR